MAIVFTRPYFKKTTCNFEYQQLQICDAQISGLLTAINSGMFYGDALLVKQYELKKKQIYREFLLNNYTNCQNILNK